MTANNKEEKPYRQALLKQCWAYVRHDEIGDKILLVKPTELQDSPHMIKDVFGKRKTGGRAIGEGGGGGGRI